MCHCLHLVLFLLAVLVWCLFSWQCSSCWLVHLPVLPVMRIPLLVFTACLILSYMLLLLLPCCYRAATADAYLGLFVPLALVLTCLQYSRAAHARAASSMGASVGVVADASASATASAGAVVLLHWCTVCCCCCCCKSMPWL